MRRGARSEQQQLAAARRAEGQTWPQIAEGLRARWPELSPRAALRVAHGWSQRDAAHEWTRLWPEQPKEARDFSLWENWPLKGRRPSLQVLERLAQLYQVSVADLVTDLADHRHLDGCHTPVIDQPSAPSQAPAGVATAAGTSDHGVVPGGLLAELWHTTGGVEHLAKTVDQLEAIAMTCDDESQTQVLRQLGYAHQSLGEGAYDQLRLVAAIGHFQQMHELGSELDDPDLITLAWTYQADVARRRRRYSTTTRLLEASEPHARHASPRTRARRWQTLARTYAERGEPSGFLHAIDHAEHCVHEPYDSQDTATSVTPRDVRHERAHGLTLLGRPTEALTIYAEAPSFVSGRDRTNFTIIHAQALAHAGELEEGVRLAISGLAEARSFGSARFVSRVRRMYNRLAATHTPDDHHLAQLQDALNTP